MNKTFKLHAGARMLDKILKKQTGSWVPLEFDAEYIHRGVRWLRVLNGMGGCGDREDWIADLPVVPVSVHEYNWNGDSFGKSYPSFQAALDGEFQSGLACAKKWLAEARKKVSDLEAAIVVLERSQKDPSR